MSVAGLQDNDIMLTKFTKEYWEARATKYGHTGNGNPFLYSYDQQARLYAIEQILGKLNFHKKECALDFGCGSGDFLPLLSKHFGTVYGYDISETIIRKVKNRFQEDKRIQVSNTLSEIKTQNGFDLILTVTVLQTHSKTELQETTQMLTNALSDHGYLVMLEFFTPDEYLPQLQEDKASISEWKEIRTQNGLEIHSTYNFYYGTSGSNGSWHQYRKSMLINFLRIFQHQSFAKNIFTHVSRKLITRYNDAISDKESLYKIQVLQKKMNA